MGAVANLHAAVGRLFLFTLLVSGLDKTRPKTLKVGVLSLYREKKIQLEDTSKNIHLF